ncbi:ribonuclease III [Rubricoccus marinus]|uniref:Ribonuclease 3 n=1 Tax=Rubricoccus marinus TaxID=716817 RepID=A0A259TVC9_9BACT|nr:ribonuclease III [Rubricoccus marinus]OZC01534.1 ribonuclease III [Rubricoccus marinus]
MDGTPRRGTRLFRSWTGAARTALTGALRVPAKPLRRGLDRFRQRPGSSVGEVSPLGVQREDVERLVGGPIGSLDLYEHALRHRSIFRGQPTDGTESNERLEFLGDAILGAVVAERLYRRFPDHDEGFLTRTRANLVNGKTLATFATAIGLAPLVLISDNMEASGGRTNATILADAFEAVVGAIYIDKGFTAARTFVHDVLDRCVDLNAAAEQRTNFKSQLLEFVQARALGQPTYDVIAEEGPSHDRQFTVEAVVDEVPRGRGTARSKKQAEQHAAREALTTLRASLNTSGDGAAGTPAPTPEGDAPSKMIGRPEDN